MNPAGAILDPKPASSDQLLEFFAPHADREGAVLLESTLTAHGRGQRSFAAANPVDRWRIDTHQPLPADWQTQLNRFTADRSKFYTLFLSYEFGREALTGQTTTAPADDPFPKLVCYRYDNVLEITHHSPAVTNSHTPEHKTAPRAQLISRPDPQRYLADINIIKSHIFEGDIYQANYTGQWRLQSDDPPWTVYQRLRQLNPGQYAGFANLGSHTVLSSSPERLFCVEGDIITANPIKGTIARGATEQESAHNRNSLLNSAKDRAELLMIVDLLR
ncbi:MAG TPA: chorismate-binding protein, partial [candidate division Zixibacteria bacterium]|nr:chorismate-binding protein [candidate division Zixibacteria bacterium]